MVFSNLFDSNCSFPPNHSLNTFNLMASLFYLLNLIFQFFNFLKLISLRRTPTYLCQAPPASPNSSPITTILPSLTRPWSIGCSSPLSRFPRLMDTLDHPHKCRKLESLQDKVRWVFMGLLHNVQTF